MKRYSLLLAFLLAGCSLLPGDIAFTPAPSPTPALSAEETARAFLKAWSESDYPALYAMLAPSRQATIAVEQFVARYRDIAAEAMFKSVQTNLVATREEGNEAEVKFNAAIDLYIFGTIQQENTMLLRREDGRWGVLWTPGLIFTQLASGGRVRFSAAASARADILDRKGRAFTTPQTQVVVEVVPIEMKSENAVLSVLARVLNKSAANIKNEYAKFPGDWRTEVGRLTPEQQTKANLDALNLPGIHTETTKDMRTYPRAQSAAHTIGYLNQINADELKEFWNRGYREGDLIGKSGLEFWGEPYLAGTRGGKLQIVGADGTVSATLAQAPAKQSRNVQTTLDIDAQEIAEKALGNRVGAAVVLDVTNGAVLAMVSHPAFDPNKLSQKLSAAELRALLNDPNDPLVNRAAQGAFPPGSVFKVVAYAAALEKGGYLPTNGFEDPGYWDGLGPNFRKVCWIYEDTKHGHGKISFSSALTQSCDVVFYQVGQRLDQIDRNLMPNFARAFGLGARTGIEIADAAGFVADPNAGTWRPGDPINLVIGQGNMLTTPLQIANLMAAVANGGTLYRPRLVSRVSSLADGTEKVFAPEVKSKLPISAATLASIKDALRRVTTDASGTAFSAFRGAKIISAGKTGTSEAPPGDPHSWFAGYAPADNPRIAIAVIVEHGGEGSKTAAPIFREIMEKYFALPSR
ncbi:MAG: penicillin-binding protein 2 [Chloroflexi bacterium]|nr:penicillin-binding protein 2 [Chloroflexota bacterium]